VVASGDEVVSPAGTVDAQPGIDWDAYASQYDLMAKFNPSYHENIAILREGLDSWGTPQDARICDLGAGTGNYISALFRDRPGASYTHVDFDRSMNELAEEKYRQLGLDQVVIVEEYVQRLEFQPCIFDLIICVNALYAISPQESVLREIRRWLKPGGVFFIIDFGRRNRVIDWTWYLIANTVKNHGVAECAKLIARSAELVKQNNRGSRVQGDGGYWLHSTQEFGRVLQQTGFTVEELRPCYRDYCDLAVCRK
jgi:ubiquinone/menaquinone biosynthesis C-methylase UbiE